MENKDQKDIKQDIPAVKTTKSLEDNIPAIRPTKSVANDIPAIKPSEKNPGDLSNVRKPFAYKDDKKPFRKSDRKGGKGRNQRRGRKESPYQEQVVAINRVSKTTKGGRKMSFNALVVVGDKKGKVGYAIAKASEVPSAIKKAIQQAQRNVITVPLVKGDTIPHTITGHTGSGRVFLKNAPEGTGIIAGSAARSVLELAGVKNIYSKVQGSKTPINVVRATFHGLMNLKSKEEVAELRGKDLKEL